MARLLYLALVVALTGFSSTQLLAQRDFGILGRGDSGGQLLAEQAAYDVLWYDLDLSVDTDSHSIAGTLTAYVTIVSPTAHLVLDLDSAFVVENVAVSNAERGPSGHQSFDHTAGRLRIDLGGEVAANTNISAAVTYAGVPRVAPRPPWIGGFTWAETSSGAPWVGVSCQMDGADIWWPCKDHPSDKPDSMALHFRVDTSLAAVSNGQFRGVDDHGDGTHTWNWVVTTPISNYAVTLNLAPYEEISGTYESITGESVPFSFWVLPERLDEGRERFEQFRKELRFLEETLGPYPFRADKYGVVHTPYLGMEHQTIIAYGSTFQNNAYGFDSLHFHELAHEWWANLVTAADWKDFWIHEGFASYMEALYAEDLKGLHAYHSYMARMRPRIVNKKPVAPQEARSTRQMYFSADGMVSDGDIYSKGAWILHTLRYLIGDENIRRALRTMTYPTDDLEAVTDGSQVRLVDTSDFEAVVESVYGAPVGWYFDVYLHQPELPELVMVRDAGRLGLRWKTPNDLPFPMPIDVSIDGVVHRVEVPAGSSANLDVPEEADIVVDPLGWILKAN